MTCKIVEVTPKRIYGRYYFDVVYDKEKDIYTCTCEGFAAWNRECKHIKAFKQIIKDWILNGEDEHKERLE